MFNLHRHGILYSNKRTNDDYVVFHPANVLPNANVYTGMYPINTVNLFQPNEPPNDGSLPAVLCFIVSRFCNFFLFQCFVRWFSS